MKNYCISMTPNKDKKLNSPKVNYLMDILKESKEKAEISRSKMPQTLVIFKLLIRYFPEEEDLFYVVIENSSKENLTKNIENPSPVLAICGQSSYDENAEYFVIIEKEICFKAASALQGIFITFCSYHAFGLCYPKKLQKNLKFFQRVFMDINPPTGNKREDGNKITVPYYELSIASLIQKLNTFNQDVWCL